MPEEKESKPAGGSKDSGNDESATAAKEAAGDFMKNAGATWGKMALETKGYLIAMAVMFLCSDQAKMVQGHTLIVDGGYSILV